MMNDYFYGWYFRCQGKNATIAVIPAVHLSEKKSSCSIQIITESQSLYQEFPIDQFRINRKKGIMKIGENLFSYKGICLNFEVSATDESYNTSDLTSDIKCCEKKIFVRGRLRFGKFTKPKYDIMGPFSFIPGIECRHTVYSMKHTVNGSIMIDDQYVCFEDAMGYMEGDSGSSFPDRYIWTQHFLPQGSVMLAAASIPLAGIHFTGMIGFYLCDGKEYRFATYLGATVGKLDHKELSIRQGHYRFRVRFAGTKKDGYVLKAPENGQMTRQVIESAACRAEYTLMYKNQVLMHAMTDRAAAEYDAKETNKTTEK